MLFFSRRRWLRRCSHTFWLTVAALACVMFITWRTVSLPSQNNFLDLPPPSVLESLQKQVHPQQNVHHLNTPPILFQNSTQIHKQFKIYFEGLARLGNVIFEYASFYGVVKHAGRLRDATFCGNYKDVQEFRYLYPGLTIPFQPSLPPKSTLKLINEKEHNIYDPKFMNLPNDQDLWLATFLGSWRYFMPNYTKDIRQEFQLRDSVKKDAWTYMEELTLQWMKQKKVASKPTQITYIGRFITFVYYAVNSG